MLDPRQEEEQNELQSRLRTAVRAGDDVEFFWILTARPDQLHVTTVFGSLLHFAASYGRLALVKYLVAAGLDPNDRGGVHDGTALHVAASDGHLDVVKYLHACGGRFDVGEASRNPLFGAIVGGHTDVARYLIENGIDTTVRYQLAGGTWNGDATTYAREWGRSDIVELLTSR